MDVGGLYDDHVAGGYDRDEFGLLAGGRAVAVAQLRGSWPQRDPRLVVDLGAGTGAGLLALRALAPGARLVGIDVSRAMLEVTAVKVPDAVLVHGDLARVAAHIPAGEVDVALLHFVTTYLDMGRVLSDVVAALRPGGLLSLVSTTYEAFPAIAAAAVELLGDEGLGQLNPAPRSGAVLQRAVERSGLHVVQCETFEADVSFASLSELLAWGTRSGFFTHVLDALPADAAARLPQLEGRFPLRDRYRATALLAVKPERQAAWTERRASPKK
jgi:predicted TPR repeat methyltransferase